MDKLRMESPDMTAQNIDRIADLFPNCITEMLDEEHSTPEKKVYKRAEIVVPTLDGKVSYKVPAGTQPGTTFRLKDKGVKYLKREAKGDLYVKVNIEVPTKLNHKQKKAIEDMAKELTDDCYQKKSSFKEKFKEIFS